MLRRVLAVGLVLVSAVGCSSSTSGHGKATAASVRHVSCDWTPQSPAARAVHRPPASVPATGAASAQLHTTRGTLSFTLLRSTAPCTVANFLSLAQQKYFDNSPCHRLTTAGIFVLQCGDPTGTGTGGPGYTIPDELSGHETYPAGTVAMANTGSPHTGGSQFFIVYGNTQLPPQYTVFARVTSGLSVVQKVAAAGVRGGGEDGAPNLSVTITSVTS
jgi:peptidyl-prolyl cis-trans isomerase B (cyclophilin B)